MSHADKDTQSAPEVFYEVAMDRLAAQMNRLEAIDRKLATIIGSASVIVAILGAILQLGGFAQKPSYFIVFSALAGASYIAAIVLALRAYRFIRWDFRPNLKKLSEYCKNYSDSIMRKWVANECLISYEYNEKRISSKTSDGRIAMWLLIAETVFLVCAVFSPMCPV
jgi:uncharacterized membrane protein YbhN (UPF0104 family)